MVGGTDGATGLGDGIGPSDGQVIVLAFSAPAAKALADMLAAAGVAVAASGAIGEGAHAFSRHRATVAIVDLRGATRSPPLAGLSAEMTRRDGALLVVTDRGAAAVLRRAVDEGATHLAVDPDAGTLLAIVRTARGAVARLAARAHDTAPDDTAGEGERALAWLDSRAAAGAADVALLVVAERLGMVNAAYGRRIGDQLLAAMRTRIGHVVETDRAETIVARVGGAEFVVACASEPTRDAGLSERIAGALARPFVVEGLPISVGVSLAFATREEGEPASALLARLRATLNDPQHPEAEADGDDALAADLHRAIERDEIEILFQPQVALAPADRDAIVGVEALARWEHPRLGTLGAAPLFAAAGRAGLAEILSAHIQALALRRAAAWTGRLAMLRVSINITAGDLATAGFSRRFLERLATSGFPADRLTVEVTESGLIAELDAAATSLARLRAAGVRVALDDFGTGYSSLAWLRALPVDTIKLDKAITRDIAGSDRDRAVLDGVLAIARRLGLRTVAEGVETPMQRDLLAAAGCDLYQGFLCAEPLDQAALATLVGG